MTTIATDGKTISADTLQSGDFVDQINAIKLCKINGVVYGNAGNLSEGQKYIDWVKKGRPIDEIPSFKDHFEVIWIKDGHAWWDNGSLRPIKCGVPYAIGSGASYAMGAMMAGTGPKKAVSIAMKLDAFTGGKIRTMKC